MTDRTAWIRSMVPAHLHGVVPEAATRLEGNWLQPTGQLVQDSSSTRYLVPGEKRWGPIVVGQDHLRIVSRQYDTPLTTTHLSPEARLVWDAWFSRHHSGYVRQVAVHDLMAAAEEWVVPFVIQLLGEYVWEISIDTEHTLPRRVLWDPQRRPLYRSFVVTNPRFMELTHARAHTYWNEYGRRRTAYEDSPAHQALTRLEALAHEPEL